MAKKIESIKHPKDTRVHIASKEEGAYDIANDIRNIKNQLAKKISTI